MDDKVKPFVWEPLTQLDKLLAKIATCDLLIGTYGIDVNLHKLRASHKIYFDRAFRNQVLFTTMPKYDLRWRNHGAKQMDEIMNRKTKIPIRCEQISRQIILTFSKSRDKKSHLYTKYGGDVNAFKQSLLEDKNKHKGLDHLTESLESWSRCALFK